MPKKDDDKISMVRLKNIGIGDRVMYDAHGRTHTIPVNSERDVELGEKMIARLRRAEAAGDTMTVSNSTRVRIKAPPTGEFPPRGERLTAGLVLENQRDLTYTDLLRHSRKVLGQDSLPGQPSKAEILSALQDQARADAGVTEKEGRKRPNTDTKAKSSAQSEDNTAEDADDDEEEDADDKKKPAKSKAKSKAGVSDDADTEDEDDDEEDAEDEEESDDK